MRQQGEVEQLAAREGATAVGPVTVDGAVVLGATAVGPVATEDGRQCKARRR